jgi:hypothetical protein
MLAIKIPGEEYVKSGRDVLAFFHPFFRTVSMPRNFSISESLSEQLVICLMLAIKIPGEEYVKSGRDVLAFFHPFFPTVSMLRNFSISESLKHVFISLHMINEC